MRHFASISERRGGQEYLRRGGDLLPAISYRGVSGAAPAVPSGSLAPFSEVCQGAAYIRQWWRASARRAFYEAGLSVSVLIYVQCSGLLVEYQLTHLVACDWLAGRVTAHEPEVTCWGEKAHVGSLPMKLHVSPSDLALSKLENVIGFVSGCFHESSKNSSQRSR